MFLTTGLRQSDITVIIDQVHSYLFVPGGHYAIRGGWVDSPAKIGINLWGDGSENDVKRKYEEYRSGQILGIKENDSMNENTHCVIWGTLASDKSNNDRDGRLIDSLRAGGQYFIAGSAIAQLKQLDERQKACLTSWLIEQRRLGTKCPEITTKEIKDAKHFRGSTVHKRADRLLQYIRNQTPNISSVVSFTGPDICAPAIAWSESIGMDEVKFLLDYLMEKGWLKGYEATNDKYVSTIDRYSLTVEGYARIAELEGIYTDSSQAFVAMWFHDSMSDVWEQGIKPGVEDAGYQPIRIDRQEHNNKICDEIIAEIKRSRFVVADFTQGDDGARGGVYYEAGFAHGLKIPVIFTCRKDTLDKLHFDTRQYNHIVWEMPRELRQKLKERICAIIGDGSQTDDNRIVP